MADISKTGTDWQDEELDAIVADYFAMLALDAAGQPFVKAHRARALMERTGRSHRSVEFKHMNISAVAAELVKCYSAASASMSDAGIFLAIALKIASDIIGDTLLPIIRNECQTVG